MQLIYNSTIIFVIVNLLIFIFTFFVYKKKCHSFIYISLPFLYNLFFLFFYVVVHVYIVFSGHTYDYYVNTQNEKYIIFAMIFSTLSYFFFNIGIITCLFSKSKIIKIFNINKYFKNFFNKRYFLLAIFIFIIGLLAKLGYFTALGQGNPLNYIKGYFKIELMFGSQGAGLEKYLNFLFALLNIGVDLLLIGAIKYKKNRLLAMICLIISLFFSFHSRLGLIIMIFQYSIVVSIFSPNFRKKLPIFFVTIALPLIFIMVVGLGIYRDSTNDKILSNIDYTFFVMGSNHTMRGLADVLEQKTLFEKKYYGATIILPILEKPIPRKFWKNKTLNTCAIYTMKMDPMAYKEGFAVAPGLCTDIYLNFGCAGSMIFFFICGYIMTYFQKLCMYSVYNSNKLVFPLLWAIIGSHMILLRGEDLSLIIIYQIYSIIMIFLIFTNISLKIRSK